TSRQSNRDVGWRFFERRTSCWTVSHKVPADPIATPCDRKHPMALGIESEGVRGEPIRITPTGSALGATIKGVDLRDLHDAAFARIMQAWHNYSVLLFRDQTLNDQELIAFSRRLGDLDWAPIQETGRRFVEGLPEIYIVSNVKVNGEAIGSLGDGE